MNIKKLNEELGKILKENVSDEKLLEYEEFAYKIFGSLNNDTNNCLEIEVQDRSDIGEPWLIAWYSINGDADKDKVEAFFKELDKLDGFSDTEMFTTEDLLSIYLDCDINTKQESIDTIIQSLNKVPVLINKYGLSNN